MTVHRPLCEVRDARPPSHARFGGLLRRALRRDDLDVSDCRELSADVYHLTLTTSQPASVVMKRLDPATAHRDCLLALRWLPAVGLADAGPPLLGSACDQDGNTAWSVYEWLDGRFWNPVAPEPDDIDRLVDVVASMHVRFASHPVLAEVRHHGAYFGRDAYAGRLNDAMLALAAARGDPDIRAHLAGALLMDLETAVRCAQETAPALLIRLNEVGGPDTLVHGDLWPKNVVAGAGWLRLIDWDRLGVGPAIYDLSTLLLRLPPTARRRVLDRYLAHIAAAGWPVPTVAEVTYLSTALERARLATLVSWRMLDLLHAPAGPAAAWAAEELRSILTWWHQVDPELDEEKAGVH
ncbi:phosphotransferase family enzyme [Micromonospora kangleipakensis]|uniref:Phosphotransferase family enzyme n=1 Tax=Micromonospora kangleipakensis TaxID=1077942 RepID=A0A4Q8BDP1_9ACTN|nr:aminoglycoside phosphotransferase family protein [Micromonospora kangleipakensis]RZU75788.1 phosphotransferase family enzyme [Micromonospora kangleipakensis]